MRLLLDTNVVIWSSGSPSRLEGVRTQLDEVGNDLLVSAVVAWEISIKHALRRLPLPLPPSAFVPEAIEDLGALRAPITLEHALAVADLPPVHSDPFDRLLVAQAQLLGATLVTADRVLAEYPVDTLLL